MKRRGFTLIELLAVIVILAIIALIATPIVMNTIEKSKKSAAERSADNYIDAVETAVATKRLDEIVLSDGVYSVNTNGNICIDKTTTCNGNDEVKVEINGIKPDSGSKVALTNGQVVATGTSLKIDNYKVSYNNDNNLVAKIISNKKICTLVSGTANTVGAKYDCALDTTRTFYVLGISGNDVSLIMDRNFTDDIVPATMSWCNPDGPNPEKNTCNHDGLNPYIDHIQSLWDEVSVSLPSKEQIENSYTGIRPVWIYENLSLLENNAYEYWTSTPDSEMDSWVYCVLPGDGAWYEEVSNGGIGIRPVITVSKENLS